MSRWLQVDHKAKDYQERDQIITMLDGEQIKMMRVTVETWTATRAQLENALWLRRVRSGLLASALHGGNAKGFDIAIDPLISTRDIERALVAVGGDPSEIAKEYLAYKQGKA
jgi:hypothetical protein